MSTSATILAMGRFAPDLVRHKEYPAQWYANVRAGQPVATEFGGDVMLTQEHCTEVGAALCVVAGDPATWQIDPAKIDYRALNRVDGVDRDALAEFIAALRAFGNARFHLFFRLDT